MKPLLSIIIVNWNTKDILLNCLRSIVDQTRTDHEIIVVDNNSMDQSVNAVRSAFPQVHLIDSPENLGFARANNVGLQHANGNFILFLNPDTLVLDAALDKMVSFLIDHPEIGILGPHTLNADRHTTQATVKFTPTLKRVFHTHIPLWKLIPRWQPTPAGDVVWNKTSEVEVVKGSCMMLPAKVVHSLGGMSEAHFMFSEEVDLCARAKQLGYPTWYYADASIVHLGGAATRQNVDPMIKQYLMAYTSTFRQYNPESSVVLFHLLLFIGSLWRILAWIPFLVTSKKEYAHLRLLEHRATLRYLTGFL